MTVPDQLSELTSAIETICRIARSVGLPAFGALQEQAFAALPPEMIARELFPSAKMLAMNWEVYKSFVASGGTETGLSPLLLPAGLVSIDSELVLGHQGFAFLTGGSNKVLDQYSISPSSPECVDRAAKWISLFQYRHENFARRSLRYAQTIIPEKLSTLPDLFPRPVATPTPLLNAIESALQGKPDLAGPYVSAIRLFNNVPHRHHIFRRIDTHLAPYGAFLLYRALLNRLGDEPPAQPVFDRSRVSYADVGTRFIGINVFDEFMEIDAGTLFGGEKSLVKVSESMPPDGGHVGRRQVWSNPGAPRQKTVVVFANSFFEFEERGQPALSWWFCRHFRDFHFVWSPDVQWDYVDRVQPDFVVWQGIERFLTDVPAS
jgi:hypothetical protein